MSKYLQSSTALAVAMLALMVGIISSCTTVDNTLGYDMVPPSQKVKIKIDTFNFITLQTVQLDSSLVSTAGFTKAMLGRMDNDRMGRSKAGVAVQFLPYPSSSNPFEPVFGRTFEYEPIRFDSAFLYLKFVRTFTANEQAATPMTIELYELQKVIRDSTLIHGVSDLDRDNNIIKDYITPQTRLDREAIRITTDSTWVKIPLTNDYVQRMGNAMKNAKSLQEFQDNYSKGMYITVDNAAGGFMKEVDLLLYVNSQNQIHSPSSEVVLYYTAQHEVSGVMVDTVLDMGFIASIYQPRFAVHEHQFDWFFAQHPSSTTANEVYMQGLYGVQSELKVDPTALKSWLGNRVLSLDRAELILPVYDHQDADRLNRYPGRLNNWILSGDTAYMRTRDMADMSLFGGYLNRSTMQYSVNMTHQLHDLIEGRQNTTYLVPDSMASVPSVGVIYTPNNSGSKPMLRVTYTEVPQ